MLKTVYKETHRHKHMPCLGTGKSIKLCFIYYIFLTRGFSNMQPVTSTTLNNIWCCWCLAPVISLSNLTASSMITCYYKGSFFKHVMASPKSNMKLDLQPADFKQSCFMGAVKLGRFSYHHIPQVNPKWNQHALNWEFRSGGWTPL